MPSRCVVREIDRAYKLNAPCLRTKVQMDRQDKQSLWSRPTAGVSLVAILVALGVAGIFALAVSKLTTTGLQRTKSSGARQDFEAMKQTIRTRLDCRATLNIISSTTLPLTCANFTSVSLSRSDGGPLAPSGKLGPWTIAARCTNNELKVAISRSGNDPLTGQSYSALPEATDLFRGTGNLCREYFAPGSTCTGTYDTYTGSTGGGVVCCRQVSVAATVRVGGSSNIYCSGNEYLLAGSGGGSCETTNAGYMGFLHKNKEDFVSNMSSADCINYNWTAESLSTAYAVCCPK